mmetsp:Transcript_36096/g.81134  ORF Transcript_36096/g.81134 Transcript_36096/m.81134 type:complete len:374 (+) Transcript_36096:107-1228(+)
MITYFSLLGASFAAVAAAFSTNAPETRIAVVGAGAVGCYYGGRLHDSYDRLGSETEVVFHLRGEHYDHCVANGIDVKSYNGDFRISADKLRACKTTEEMASGAAFDWVVCCLKSTSLDEVPELIDPLMSDNTRLLIIMNGLIEEDLITKMRERQRSKGLEGMNAKAIYGGMALICSNRLSPGQISHTYGGKLVCGVAYSQDADDDDSGKWTEQDKSAILSLFEPVQSVPFEFEPNLRRGRWWKNVWNLPFSGLSCSMGGVTVDKIVTDPSLRSIAYKVINETIDIANADLKRMGCSEDEFLGKETGEEMMTLSDNMGAYRPSTMIDLLARNPMEVRYLFREAINRADSLGVPCPHLETVVCHIEAYQREHNLF